MSDALVFTLTLLAALGSGAVARVFLGFSTFVMHALADLPAAQGIRAMQAINTAAVRPPFMIAFAGTAVVCVALSIAALIAAEPGAGLLLAGSVAYLGGTLGLTAGVHVPANDALARLDPQDEAGGVRWADYVRRWTRWNHVRTVAGLAASVCFVLALPGTG
jgi:uncharacterized membrane protein